MKRLTKKIDNGRFVTTDAEARSYGETDPEDGFFYNYFTGEAVDKLAAYEDTGLEPADIEELLAKVPHWISVEERLPEKHNTVLFYIPWNKTNMIGWIDEGGDINLEGYGKCYDFSLVKPSHWMPLPEAPKEGTE